jgi:hypothetical protein
MARRLIIYLDADIFLFGKKRKASKPPSRPTPDCFIPPNGVRKSRKSHVLTQTIPLSIFPRRGARAKDFPSRRLPTSRIRRELA